MVTCLTSITPVLCSNHGNTTNTQVVEQIVSKVGKPRNYGPTEEEQLELERIGMERKIKQVRHRAVLVKALLLHF